MTEAVEKLLDKATILADAIEDNLALNNAIKALSDLGDEANGNSQEFKDLKTLVKELEEPKELEVVLSCVYGDKQPNDTIKLPVDEARELIDRGWAVQK